MQPDERDAAYLWDMAEAAREVHAMVDQKIFADPDERPLRCFTDGDGITTVWMIPG